MRALIIYCHPDPNSFTAAVLEVIKEKLTDVSAQFRIEDLYDQGFDPILSQQHLADYLDTDINAIPVQKYIDNLDWCDTLIFVYPTWWYGLPAILKGWLDRTMLPGSAFHLPKPGEKVIKPGFGHITRIAVFTTCGASWFWTQFIGAPGKRTLLRGVRFICARRIKTAFAAHYSMDSSTPESRAKHLEKVKSKMHKFLGSVSF